jgi:hypothetical protein
MAQEPTEKKAPRARTRKSTEQEAAPRTDEAAEPRAAAGGERAKAPRAAKAAKAAPKPVNERWEEAGPEDEFVISLDEIAAMAAMWDGGTVEKNNADGRRSWLRLWRRK